MRSVWVGTSRVCGALFHQISQPAAAVLVHHYITFALVDLNSLLSGIDVQFRMA